ncbi:hypothetical protein LIER_16580 [Lithospermum erythrorhizon]|uniref:Uncharacterized protein n=1 Tax=Lithospermum erythrorhizon TaxID=34254 RepID=A0AAV3Q9U8_LITER
MRKYNGIELKVCILNKNVYVKYIKRNNPLKRPDKAKLEVMKAIATHLYDLNLSSSAFEENLSTLKETTATKQRPSSQFSIKKRTSMKVSPLKYLEKQGYLASHNPPSYFANNSMLMHSRSLNPRPPSSFSSQSLSQNFQ